LMRVNPHHQSRIRPTAPCTTTPSNTITKLRSPGKTSHARSSTTWLRYT